MGLAGRESENRGQPKELYLRVELSSHDSTSFLVREHRTD